MSLAPLHLAIAAAMIADVPSVNIPRKMLPVTGQESSPRTRPAKGGTFTVKSTGGATIATVSIKGGTGGNPATMVVTLQPATAGAATPAAIQCGGTGRERVRNRCQYVRQVWAVRQRARDEGGVVHPVPADRCRIWLSRHEQWDERLRQVAIDDDVSSALCQVHSRASRFVREQLSECAHAG